MPWQEQVAAVARVYHALSPQEQGKAAIFCDNYGQAGAIDFFGPRYRLPRANSGHQNCFFFGPRSYTGEIVILVGQSASDARKEFSSVEVGATLDIPYAYFYETRPILLCRGLKGNLQAVWPRVKTGVNRIFQTKLQKELRQRIAFFCTAVHSFPQRNLQIPLARKTRQVYCLAQIEPESFKNFAAQ